LPGTVGIGNPCVIVPGSGASGTASDALP